MSSAGVTARVPLAHEWRHHRVGRVTCLPHDSTVSLLLTTFADLSTPLVADACVRSDVPLRAAPPGIGALVPGHRIAGRALPARHYGSVDVFLEAFSRAEQGDVLVIDNGGRSNEA